MAQTCTTGRLILGEIGSGEYWYYDRLERRFSTAFYASIEDPYNLPSGSIVGATNFYNPNQVWLLKVDNAFGLYPDYIILQSTSGDTNNKLISSVVVGDNLVVTMYALVAKEITVLTFPMPVVYDNQSPAELRPHCFTDYNAPADILLNSYCDGTTLVQVYTDGEDGLTTTYTTNSVTCGYTPQLEPVTFTETKIIKYVNECVSNPVYLVWKNTLGGWDSWLFQHRQVESLSTSTLGSFFKYYETIASLEGTSIEIGKMAMPTMQLGADSLTIGEKRGISQILYSNKVYIYDPLTEAKQEVRVTEGTFVIEDNKRAQFNIEFQIELPELNTIRN